MAVVLHLLAAPLLAELGGVRASVGQGQDRPRRVRMIAMTGDRVQRPRLPSRPIDAEQPPAKRPQEEKKERLAEREKKGDEQPVGRVVDIPPTKDDRAPENARYSSEYNTRVERESRSRHATGPYENAMNERTIARADQGAKGSEGGHPNVLEIGPEEPKTSDSPVRKEVQQAQKQALEVPKVEERERLALALDPGLGTLRNAEQSEAMHGNSDRLRLSLGQDAAAAQSPGSAPLVGQPLVNLVPQVGVLAKISGSPANDKLEDVDEGEGTFLNSREFKFAGFFNRMKRGVSQHWNPVGEYRRRDPTGQVYGQLARVTVLQVTLSAEGKVKDLAVRRSSGLDFLDHEAMQAFKRAEPFQNPPRGLVTEQGDFSFPFAFHLEFRDGGLRLPF